MSPNMFSQINSSFQGTGFQDFYTFLDDVELDSVRAVIQWILEANNAEERPDMLNLLICSGGGDLNAAFALIDIMRGSYIPVRTIGIGMIASAGLMIFMAGQEGERVLTKNTAILSHQFSSSSWGKSHELLSATKSFDLTSTKVLDHYLQFSNLDEEQIKELLLPPTDVWLSAQEALKYGLCDSIKTLK